MTDHLPKLFSFNVYLSKLIMLKMSVEYTALLIIHEISKAIIKVIVLSRKPHQWLTSDSDSFVNIQGEKSSMAASP